MSYLFYNIGITYKVICLANFSDQNQRYIQTNMKKPLLSLPDLTQELLPSEYFVTTQSMLGTGSSLNCSLHFNHPASWVA